MRHFAYLSDEERDRLFAVAPQAVAADSPRDLLALGLGATLYCPGTRSALVADSLRVASVGTTSMVWCLEDSIPHESVSFAETNVVAALRTVHAAGPAVTDRMPLLFLRARDADQVRRIAEAAGDALRVLTGFSLPKLTPDNAPAMLAAVREAATGLARPLYAMPILETPDIAYVESRRAALAELAAVFDDHRERVLCVRVGGTDLSGLFGLRRDRDTTVWDIAVVRDALSDIVNQFARGGRYVVTGAVWEHIPGARLFKPQLRESPFLEQHAGSLRRRMIDDDVDALLREISLDRSNGLHGKTVIHPTHVSVVNSLLAVGWDEYDDARAIRDAGGVGGAVASAHGRMNELGPHALWADQVLARATAFGVVREGASLVELLALGQRAVAAEYGLPVSSVRVVS